MNFSENHFFFKNNELGHNLYGVDYIPEEPTGEAFIFLQPLGSERNVIDAVIINLARTFAKHGIRVLRFDYYGTGDSEGDFTSITLASLMSDIDTGMSLFSNNAGITSTGLLGVRFGSLLASHFAEQTLNTIKHLILCAPVINAFDYINKELMQALSMQTVLFNEIIWDRIKIIHELLEGQSTVVQGYNLANLNGFPLTKELFLSIKDIDTTTHRKNYDFDCLLVNIDTRKRKRNKIIEALEKKYSKAKKVDTCEIIEKTIPWVHGKHLLKTSDTLNKTIINWLRTNGKTDQI